MEDKKNVPELYSSSELPFIEKKVQKKSYSPKLSHKLRKPQNNNSNEYIIFNAGPKGLNLSI